MNDAIDSGLPNLPVRESDGHKGTYGRVLIIAGSRGMCGAAGLAGMSALRGGAGLVTVAVPDCCLETVAAYSCCYTTLGLPNDQHGRIGDGALEELRPLFSEATAVAIGPGLGRSAELTKLVSHVFFHLAQPLVCDADGLNALSEIHRDDWTQVAGMRVLTPHPGEFRRLTRPWAIGESRSTENASALAAATQSIVVLKGQNTIVTDGEVSWLNSTGNPGMAAGGSGDVLTGILAALLAQGLDAQSASRLGVYLHGLAGDLGAEEKGQESLIATDLIETLPAAFLRYRATRTRNGS